MSSSTLRLTENTKGIFHVDSIPAEAPALVNKLLQINHDQFHIFWETQRGMHNHQTHYLLTDFALGATLQQLQHAFDSNLDYMRPIHSDRTSEEHKILGDNYFKSLGHFENYGAWLSFFHTQVTQLGWRAVVNHWLFSGSPQADDMIVRMFEGSLHPIIHLGFGVEFEQPAVIAEAFAQAAIHPQRASSFLRATEELASSKKPWSHADSLKNVFIQARQDPVVSRAECWKAGSYDRNRDFWADLPPEFVELATNYKLDPSISAEDLHMRTAEFLSVTAWFACAAQRRDKQPKFDFYLMHCVNCSIFFSAFETQEWMEMKDKVRLLELMVRMGLVFYVCQGSPELLIEEIVDYKPRLPHCMTWPELIANAIERPDDGHIVKFVRALNNASAVCEPYETNEHFETKFPIKGDMYLKIANMVLDSTEHSTTTLTKWLRGYALPDSWDKVPDK